MAPAAVLVPSLIGAGASIGGGLLASRKSKQEKEALNQQSLLAQTQRQQAEEQRARGTEMWNTASPLMTKIRDYYQTLLEGNRGAMSRLMAPQMEGIGEQYAASEKDILSNVPRGGEMGLALAQNRMGKARDIGTLYNQAPQIGMGGLQDLFALLTGQATGAGNSAVNATNSAANIYQGIIGNERDRAQYLGQMGSSAGLALGQMLAQMLNPTASSSTTGQKSAYDRLMGRA